ncbi:MAG: O-antigen ligase family protein [bacterium]
MSQIKIMLDEFFKNTTKVYLVLANVVLVVFAIWFSNVGLLPFKNFGDFAFFAALALILGLYRPGWTFVLFVGALALENVNIAPNGLGLSLRPYQFFGLITIGALLVQAASKRLAFSLPKFGWYDFLPIIFAVSGFFSAFGAQHVGASTKQAVIALSFVALYFLTRIYVQSWSDLKRIMPFFLSSAVVVSVYAIWQNVLFVKGGNSFEVMPGRPNATFVEADWLGIYITFLIGIVLTMLYYFNKNESNNDSTISKIFNIKTFLYFAVCILFVVLMLTASRSAWVGTFLLTLGFLKVVLLYGKKTETEHVQKNGFWKSISVMLKAPKSWRNFFVSIGMLVLSVGIGFAMISIFHLTTFQLKNRAVSTGGWQKITIACNASNNVPQRITSIDDLEQYSCRHINLEEIEKEKTAGSSIMEVERPDPNVNLRAEIYQKSIDQVKKHPFFGIGWGSISNVLGKDARGAGLNASNIFLEIWLGSGILGIFSIAALLIFLFVIGCKKFVQSQGANIGALFVLFGLFAILIPNMFNSGIFLGFVWVYLAVAISLLVEKNNKI